MRHWPFVAAFVLSFGLVQSVHAAAEADAAKNVRWTDLPYTDTVFAPVKYNSLAEWKERSEWLRRQVRFAAGLWPEYDRTPLNARVFGKLERDGYTIEKVYFESFPGLYVTGNLYRPRDAQGKRPAVACPHGHWSKGRLTHEDLGSVPARCITLARLGAVVFSYDMIGYNDSGRQLRHGDEGLNAPHMVLWMLGSFHFQTWNSVRVLDFLQSLPDVDPARIGVTGASGGGTQTFILSALDDRVQVAAPVNMISSTMQGGCSCENAPTLRIDANNMEIGALFAPKPLLLVSATGDWTKRTPEVEYPMIRGVYELYGAAQQISNVHIDAPHNYNLASREAVYNFFARWLLRREDAGSIKEGDIQLEKPEDLLVFSNEADVPANMPKLDELAAKVKAACRARIEALRPTSRENLAELKRVVRTGLKHMVGSAFPPPGDVSAKTLVATTQGSAPTEMLLMTRHSRPVSTKRFLPTGATQLTTGAATIVLHPAGLKAEDELKSLIRQRTDLGDYVLLAEPFGTGDNRPPADLEKPRGSTKYFTAFNRTDAAETVFDILTVLGAVLHDEKMGRVSVAAFGETGPMCLLARALVPDNVVAGRKLMAVIDMNRFNSESEEAYLNGLMLPGILRIGGLRAVGAVAAGGPLWIHNAGTSSAEVWLNDAAKLTGTAVRFDLAAADPAAVAKWVNAGTPGQP